MRWIRILASAVRALRRDPIVTYLDLRCNDFLPLLSEGSFDMPLVYTPPNFNVVASVWRPPALPSTSLPTFTGVPCQIYLYGRTPTTLFHPASGRELPLIIIRHSAFLGTQFQVDDIFQHSSLPLEPANNYKVQYRQRMHAGFPNQYIALFCLQCNANGTIPRTPLPT